MNELSKKLGAFKGVSNMRTNTGSAANQFEIDFESGTIFQSYNSIIVVMVREPKLNVPVTHGTWETNTYIGEDFEYSRTTMKYLSQFLGHGVSETRKKLESGDYKMIKENN